MRYRQVLIANLRSKLGQIGQSYKNYIFLLLVTISISLSISIHACAKETILP